MQSSRKVLLCQGIGIIPVCAVGGVSPGIGGARRPKGARELGIGGSVAGGYSGNSLSCSRGSSGSLGSQRRLSFPQPKGVCSQCPGVLRTVEEGMVLLCHSRPLRAGGRWRAEESWQSSREWLARSRATQRHRKVVGYSAQVAAGPWSGHPKG